MEVVPYAREHRDQILTLLDDVPFKSLIWDWQFEHNPHAISFEPVVMVQDGQVIGFNGVMPVHVKYGDRRMEALWSCDFYVSGHCRGLGVGKRIKEHLFQQSPLIMSFGVSSSASHVLTGMGWRKAEYVHDYRLLRQAGSLREGLLKGLQYCNRVPGLFGNGHAGHFQWEPCLPNRESVDELWESVEDGYEKICVRDYDYLHWKYESHPLARYDFLIARTPDGQLEGMLVVRASERMVRIVDYLGPRFAYSLKRALVGEVCRAFPEVNRFSCTTSDTELGKALCHSGFFRARTRPSFFVRSTREGDVACEDGWFLMTGDSDGELLAASAAAFDPESAPQERSPPEKEYTPTVYSGSGVPRLSLKRLSPEDFASVSADWQDLLSQSDSDRLFMSWPWLYSWWETWSRRLGLELVLLAIYEDHDHLVGLAPFYTHEVRSPVGFRIRRIQFLGNAWKIQGTVRTEYSSLIIKRGYEATVTQAVLSELYALKWHEMVVCDQNLPELLRWQDGFDAIGRRVTTVPRTMDSGVRVLASGNFEDWLAGLGRNTRLKAYNRRRYLADKGKLRVRQVAVNEAPEFLEQLNDFHRRRWGKPCFDEGAVAFHLKLMSRLAEDQLVLSALEFDGETISVLYDIRAGQSRYNLQAGFLEDFDGKVALGTLHLGYAIEESFGDQAVAYYDLLAGYGKKSFYKSRFQGETVHFLTVQFARHPMMRAIYRLQTMLPGSLRKSINRLVRL